MAEIGVNIFVFRTVRDAADQSKRLTTDIVSKIGPKLLDDCEGNNQIADPRPAQ